MDCRRTWCWAVDPTTYRYVDMDDKGNGTLRRSRKDSFYWFKKVCESNGADLTV